MRYRLGREQRISRNEDFLRVLRQRCMFRKGLMRLYAAPNELGYPRLGVSVGRRCGPAVVRNRLKRLCREVFRLNQHRIAPDLDYLLIFSEKSPTRDKRANSLLYRRLSFDRLGEDFLELGRRAAEKFPADGCPGEAPAE